MSDELYVRKMSYIAAITAVIPIPGADRICQYEIDSGWNVVDQVGKYQVTDLVVYASIDSWIPTTVAPFLTKPGHHARTYNGVDGEKLRTIRLRKVLSQGLILPLSVLGTSIVPEIGTDVSEQLGIQKWEAPPEFTSADARGLFPDFIFKTDQERIQNCYNRLSDKFEELDFEMQEKCEGSSLTAYFYNGDFGVASRNLNLKESEDNTFWKTALKYNLRESLTSLGLNIAIQGELCGPGIQGNIYGLDDYRLFVFDVFDINTQSYYTPTERRALTEKLGLTDAPVIDIAYSLKGKTLADILSIANGMSVIGNTKTRREGLVFKANTKSRLSVKAISDEYLLKLE